MTLESPPDSTAELQLLIEEYKQQIFKLEHELLKQKHNEILVQMAGSIAHDLSQPLTVILSNIDLIRIRKLVQDEKLETLFERIASSSAMISDIVKRVQTIYQRGPLPDSTAERDAPHPEKTKACLVVENDALFEKLRAMLAQQDIEYELDRLAADELRLDDAAALFPDVILIDFGIESPQPLEFIRRATEAKLEIPLTLLIDSGAERSAAALLDAGVMDYAAKSALTSGGLSRMLQNSIRRFWLSKEIERARLCAEGDPLEAGATEIFSQQLFDGLLCKEFEYARDYHDILTVLVVGIDNWQELRTHWPDEFRNRLLLKIGNDIKALTRKTDICARLEEGRFGLILPGAQAQGAREFGQRLERSVRQEPIVHRRKETQLELSCGVATASDFSQLEPRDLYIKALVALATVDPASSDKIAFADE